MPVDHLDDLTPEQREAVAKADRAAPCGDCGRFFDPGESPAEPALCDACRSTLNAGPPWSGAVPWTCSCCIGVFDAAPPDARFGLCAECLAHWDASGEEICLARATDGWVCRCCDGNIQGGPPPAGRRCGRCVRDCPEGCPCYAHNEQLRAHAGRFDGLDDEADR